MRRLTWFMLKHNGAKAHWNDEERPWNSFVQSNVRQGGMPFIFIVHHLSIVFLSMNDSRTTTICMLIIWLAISLADTHVAIFCQIESLDVFWQYHGWGIIPSAGEPLLKGYFLTVGNWNWKWAISTSYRHDMSARPCENDGKWNENEKTTEFSSHVLACIAFS